MNTQPSSSADALHHLSEMDQPASRNFTDRRIGATKRSSPGLERRQFSDSHSNLSPEAAQLGLAIDQYKLENHRRFISYEELITIIKNLGYSKSE